MRIIPRRFDSHWRRLRRIAGSLGRKRLCPVCGHRSGRFEPFGIVPREDARCPWCDSLERHRLAWLFFNRRTDLFSGASGRRILHVAPEPCFQDRFRRLLGPGYLTADLFPGGVDVKMDICNIAYPDGSFDVVYCSHVLEHVPDDRRAMREFHRVLVPGGWAVLLVPITVAETIEDPSVSDPKERLRRFGQEDHVRCYGPDYPDRLKSAGFRVDRVLPSDFLSAAEIALMGINPAAGEIYFCAKSAGPAPAQ